MPNFKPIRLLEEAKIQLERFDYTQTKIGTGKAK